jgi:probable phosphoglycerate mutase
MSPKSTPDRGTPSLFGEISGPHAASKASPEGPLAPWITANVDGGARGNPGPAGYGVYIRDVEGRVIAELSEYLGHKTNNFAEYSALLAALEYAIKNNFRALKVISDSELMVRQMTGVYKVNSPELRPLFERARNLVRQLDKFSIEHVLRGRNQHADQLANTAMDRGMGKKPREL